jgi:hypothetical protein
MKVISDFGFAISDFGERGAGTDREVGPPWLGADVSDHTTNAKAKPFTAVTMTDEQNTHLH